MSLISVNGIIQDGVATFKLTNHKVVTAKSVDANIEYDEQGNIVAFEVLDFYNQKPLRKAKMQTIPVTVYTNPNCVQCDMTKRLFDKAGVEYSVVDLTSAPDKVAEFKEQGLLAAPIVTTDIKIWSGFRKTKIESLIQAVQAERAHE